MFGIEYVGPAGDVDGDSFIDLMAMDPSTQMVLVYRGSPSGPSSVADYVIMGTDFGPGLT
jgi:hypothetical protein